MRIKRFVAPDNQTALRMVKQEMGGDALILATRTLPPSERKQNGNAKIEVVAAIDFDVDKITASTTAATEMRGTPAADTYDYSVVRQHEDKRPDTYGQGRPQNDPVRPTNHGSSPSSMAMSHGEKRDAVLQRSRKKMPPSPRAGKLASAPVNTRPTDDGFAIPAARKEKPDPEKVARWRQQLIDRIIVQPPTVIPGKTDPAVIALVGATGVGKTTTAAKLAAWYSLRQGLKVTLISMDCYRIGATEQLRTYAKIMRLPCEVALNRKDLAKAIKRYHEQDLIILDTAGKSPYHKEHVAELANWFDAAQTIHPYVVVSATSKKEDLEQILRAYRPLMPAGIMLTKLDETRAYATLCQSLASSALPVATLSIGQKVPEDFLPASREFLATLFQEGWHAAAAEMGAA